MPSSTTPLNATELDNIRRGLIFGDLPDRETVERLLDMVEAQDQVDHDGLLEDLKGAERSLEDVIDDAEEKLQEVRGAISKLGG